MFNVEHSKLVLATVLAGAFGLTACAQVEAVDPTSGLAEPAVVEPVQGSPGLSRVTLTEQAAERLDLTTAPVKRSGDGRGQARMAVPYGAVIYDPDGGTWAYAETEPLVYVRKAIDVAHIQGGVATLRSGPAAGTDVVTVGAAELWGAEVGVDH